MTRGLHWKVLILKLERLLSNSTDLMFTRSCWVKIEQQTPSPDSRDNPWLDYLALPYIAPALGVNIQIASESSPPPPPASAPRQTLDLIWILWQCQVALFLSTRPTMCQSESSGCDEAAECGHCHHTAWVVSQSAVWQHGAVNVWPWLCFLVRIHLTNWVLHRNVQWPLGSNAGTATAGHQHSLHTSSAAVATTTTSTSTHPHSVSVCDV